MSSDRSKCWGMFTRKERWGLSWRGWSVMATAAAAALLTAGLLLLGAHSFLAQTHRVDAKILVVEGWIHDYGVQAAIQEFKNGHYDRILTTGGPVEGIGTASSIYDTDAYQSAWLLGKAGIPAQSVPSDRVGRDRTYNSAVTLRRWFQENHLTVDSINVLTEDAHARRTRLLFQEALGPDIEVGIISAANPDYDASRWWRSSEGVRAVIGESLAYIYAKFLFWPGSSD
jgi:uncharacterized SAM-binding protein YcdF (DUF218 family)